MRNAFPPGRRGPSRIGRPGAANAGIVTAKLLPNQCIRTTKIRPWRRDLWCRASMHYRRASHRATNSLEARGRGAVGSAQPCQGWGRGFESRRPLDGADASTPAVEWPSGEATACKAVHTGSIPVSTSKMGPARLAQRESASLTRKRSLVQSQYRAPVLPHVGNAPQGRDRPHVTNPGSAHKSPTTSSPLVSTTSRGGTRCPSIRSRTPETPETSPPDTFSRSRKRGQRCGDPRAPHVYRRVQLLTCTSDFDLVDRNAMRPRSIVFADTSRRGRGSTTKSATPEWRRRRQRRANWCGTWSNRVAAIPRPRRSTPLPRPQAHHGSPTGRPGDTERTVRTF